MIKNEAGEKCTPKDLANEILGKGLSESVLRWEQENAEAIAGITERELALLNDQVAKQFVRAIKPLGYKPDDIEVPGDIEERGEEPVTNSDATQDRPDAVEQPTAFIVSDEVAWDAGDLDDIDEQPDMSDAID